MNTFYVLNFLLSSWWLTFEGGICAFQVNIFFIKSIFKHSVYLFQWTKLNKTSAFVFIVKLCNDILQLIPRTQSRISDFTCSDACINSYMANLSQKDLNVIIIICVNICIQVKWRSSLNKKPFVTIMYVMAIMPKLNGTVLVLFRCQMCLL